MSNTKPPSPPVHPGQVGTPLTLKEVGGLLVKHYGLTEGKYDPMIEYQIGGGMVGPNAETRVPGMMVGVLRLGLTKSIEDGPLTLDASLINPPRRKRTV